MNWEAIGAIAEAVGAAGVIASLVYLGVQIRSNTRAAKVAAYQQMIAAGRDLSLAVFANNDLFETMVRRWGLTDQEEIDKTREGLFFDSTLAAWESQVYQHEQGMLDDRLGRSVAHVSATLSPAIRTSPIGGQSRQIGPSTRPAFRS